MKPEAAKSSKPDRSKQRGEEGKVRKYYRGDLCQHIYFKNLNRSKIDKVITFIKQG